jgi:hypothetical protein
MPETSWLQSASPAFRLMIATSWLAPAGWQEQQEEAIREALRAGLDWIEYLRLVDRHRTPALSWAALKRVPGLEIPEPARRELQKRSDACRMQAVRYCIMLAEVLRGFNRAGIPVMPFKGPTLSLDLYGDVGLRQSKDLDLAVTLEDVSRAQACLESMGWRVDSGYFPLTPRQWEGFLRHEFHIGFVHSSGGGGLELHWRNHGDAPGQAGAQWARNVPSEWQRCSYLAMTSIDLVLYLCSHGGRHAWIRAKWLGDMARIRAEGRVDWAAALDQARKTGQERPMLAALRLLKDVYGLPVPELPGDPWKNLPPFLIGSPLHALKVAEDPASRGSLALLRDGIRLNRYDGLVLLPHRTWRDVLADYAYRREDFRVFRLPDSLYWAYVPLRPILWVWRRVLRRRPANR